MVNLGSVLKSSKSKLRGPEHISTQKAKDILSKLKTNAEPQAKEDLVTLENKLVLSKEIKSSKKDWSSFERRVATEYKGKIKKAIYELGQAFKDKAEGIDKLSIERIIGKADKYDVKAAIKEKQSGGSSTDFIMYSNQAFEP